MALDAQSIPKTVGTNIQPDENNTEKITLFWEKLNFSVVDPEKKVPSQGEYVATDTKPGMKEPGAGNENPNSKNSLENNRR